ncbi:MAG: hypothetical protein Q4F30_10590 [Akkermansia sp.]|nr:hypothetical protein [Akkermansia sp.]
MISPVIAFNLQEFAGKFGLHTEAFIAHFIAFAVVVCVVVFFGIKPVMAQLEERRKRIEEGEAMHERSKQELADVKATGEKILTEARDTGKQEVEQARQTAARLQADLSAKATAEAQTVIENARRQAAMDSQREKEALKGEFVRLVAAATAQVTGKVLSEEDHRRINDEAINNL